MRITMKTQYDTLDLIVKIAYDYTDPIVKRTTDKYGREVITTWREHRTTVKCYEYSKKSTSCYVGTAICDYRDKKQYDKKKGREIAWANALEKMVNIGFIDKFEAFVLQSAGLNCTRAKIDMTDKKRGCRIEKF